MRLIINTIADALEARKKIDRFIAEHEPSSVQVNNMEYVDLGLPSGKLWAAENASHDGKTHFRFDEAREAFRNAMPTADDFQELHDACNWRWDDERNGYTVTGTNGNSIFLPASGFRFGSGLSGIGGNGYYWSRTTSGAAYARSLEFWSGRVDPQNYGNRDLGFAVRLVR